METTVAQLAALVGGGIEGDPNARVAGVANVDEAGSGDVVLAADERFFRKAMDSDAACILTGGDTVITRNGKSIIRTSNPTEAFSKILGYFRGVESLPAVGIGPGAVIEPDAELGENVAIGANCYIGRGASLGDGCVLFPNVYIGDGVRIGADGKIYPGAVVYANCAIGKRVIIHAGAVIGADGFGYTCEGHDLVKLPHAGTVEVGDDVEIGANATIDRAKTGATVIGNGTKIDNLVHIAHNCRIGRNCVIVALVGIAGSVTVGDGVTLAGQSGVKDHVMIGDGAIVAARAGVIGDIEKGQTVSGFPARDHKTELRLQAARMHLPEILQRLRALEAEVERLRASGKDKGDDDSGF